MLNISTLLFSEKFFGPKHESIIVNHKNLNKKTLQTLLNKLFSLDKKNNENIMQEYIANTGFYKIFKKMF